MIAPWNAAANDLAQQLLSEPWFVGIDTRQEGDAHVLVVRGTAVSITLPGFFNGYEVRYECSPKS